ncbi:MAG TPA: 2-hydroxy-3-oxopropionate reductase, partial [Pseudomonas sp.]|nr:2-hydroxy-3-oxopropionate reductase [Pseudomonas sp.]
EAQDLERVRPALLALGQRVTHMGGVGAGQVTKACNQMIVACNALVIAEVVALAEKSGVDASLIAEALAGGFADSKPLQILAPQMAESRFEPVKWHVRTLLKDLDTAVKFSREQGSATPVSGLAAQLMRLHGSQGYLEKDPATLIDLYRSKP